MPIVSVTGSPDRVSALPGPGTRPGIRPVIRHGQRRGPAIMSRFPAAFRPPAFASRSPCSRPGTGPSSRSAYRAPPGARTRTGFPRFTPARYDRGGCPLYPGDGGALPGRMPCPAGACRFPAASPCTPQPHPTSGATHHEASTRVHAIHPSGLPLACGLPDGTGDPWAFPCAPHPAVTGGARQGGAGP